METHSTTVNTTAWFTGYQNKWIATSITALAVAVLASFGAYYGSQVLFNNKLTYGAYSILAISIGVLAYALLHIKKTSQAISLSKLSLRKQHGLEAKMEVSVTDTSTLTMYNYKVSWERINQQDVMKKLKENAPFPKQVILESVCVPNKGSFNFAQYELKQGNWIDLCNQFFKQLPQMSVETTPDFYDYKNIATYCVFGNKYYGGGHLENGYTQEEMAVLQSFNSTALTYFCTRPEVVKGSKLNPERPRPLLLYNVSQELEFKSEMDWCQYHISPETNKTRIREEIGENITSTFSTSTYNLVSIVAIDWRENTSPDPSYTIEQLKYLLEAAYAACHAITLEESNGLEQTFHTGLWGCGIFKNSLYVMITIQLLAARMAGIKIKFYGIKEDSELENAIPKLVDIVNEDTPSVVLETIRSLQFDEDGKLWKPQVTKKNK